MDSQLESSSDTGFKSKDKIISGLGALCPEMSLTSRQRKKGSASSLQVKFGPSFTELMSRIRELELALAEVHGTQSDVPHHLLAPETKEGEGEDEVDDLSQIVGTLKIDQASGCAKFFGRTAGMESLYLLDNDEDEIYDTHARWCQLGDALSSFIPKGIMQPMSSETLLDLLVSNLPSAERAWNLCETYYTCVAWLFAFMPETKFQNQIYNPIYSTTPPSLQNIDCTNVAVLYMVLALGSVVGSPVTQDGDGKIASLPNNEVEGICYHRLARRALAAGQSIGDGPTVTTLEYGRPPLITADFYDCDIGPAPEKSANHYYHRRRIVTSTLLVEVRDLVSKVQQKYSEVLLLDRKLRDKAVAIFGGSLGSRNFSPDIYNGLTTAERLQTWWMLVSKELLCLYLHRRYFVKVCIGSSEELTTNRYSPSFFAAFRSAQAVIALMLSIKKVEPVVFCRFGIFSGHLLASAILVGSVVILHPQSIISPEAMKSLEEALMVANEFAMRTRNCSSSRPIKTLKKIQKIHSKAVYSLQNPEDAPDEGENTRQSNELSALGGLSRTLQNKNDQNTGMSTSPVVPSTGVDLNTPLLNDFLSASQNHGTFPHNDATDGYDILHHDGFTPSRQQFGTIWNVPQQEQAFSLPAHEWQSLDMENGLSTDQFIDTGLAAEPPNILALGNDFNWQGFIDGLGL
ncbi:hypothetical protein M422DRAFT_274722 [Sphaerobolus stellatus SS14]|uniref:Unplaced genomic scaffold SPHSTscaffold_410, whole genome shotgun sequence n=1 Tax=Sphaerobolus stellatus (strain SS14) TaxID=990650 RepID=A0A0C9T6D7_SPHS4|nr:hypothetical protein M422DRAFT_274722 [Sphaerobolus stellatus SS14]